ncbi:HEPN domain-containing protein [Candidatus Parcubacteria bacterium]|nr:HEPN domain-containing protein [Candidatus Parcubacteria bacterium]
MSLNIYYIEFRYSLEITVYSKAECKEAIECIKKITQFVINEIM